MITHDDLQDIASERNWLVFAHSLSVAIQNMDSHGFRDESRLVAHVAVQRGVQAESLSNHMKAYRWIKSNVPHVLRHDDVKVSMVGVLVLDQICRLSPELLPSLEKKFFGGKIGRLELKKLLSEIQEKNGKGVRGHELHRRSTEYDLAVRNWLTDRPHLLGFGKTVTVLPGDKKAIVPADLLIEDSDDIVAGVLIKRPALKRNRQRLVTAIAYANFLSISYGSAVIILPKEWVKNISEMVEMISKYGLSKIRIGVFDDGQNVSDDRVFYYPENQTYSSRVAVDTKNDRPRMKK